jgi:hypothetical protein
MMLHTVCGVLLMECLTIHARCFLNRYRFRGMVEQRRTDIHTFT